MKTVLKQYKSTAPLCLMAVFVALFTGVKSVDAAAFVSARASIHAQDTFALDVFLDTEGSSLNAVGGTLKFGGDTNMTVTDIQVAGSALNVWPRKPSLDDDGKTITFTGGTTQVVSGTRVPLFTIFGTSKKQGSITVASLATEGYASDGSAKKIAFPDGTMTIPVAPAAAIESNALVDTLHKDKTAPESFTIELLHDSLLYNGMQFLSFETTDSQSGIAYYEVQEGSLEPVRSGSTYVLQDQKTIHKITVKAFDLAGNVRVETFNEEKEMLPIVLGSVVVLLAVLALLRKQIVRLYTTYVAHKK